MLINQDFTWDRTKYIGGSDIGAILGLSKYRTPLQVWQEKAGQELPKQDSMPLRFGSFAEEFIAREYAQETGSEVIEHPEPFIHPEYSFLSGHIDRFVLEPNCSLFQANGNLNAKRLLECKTANPFAKDEWGEIGSDEVPMSYLVQCAWYLLLTGCERADLAVFFSSSDFRIYSIHKDLELEKMLLKEAVQFWEEYVLAKTPPPPINEADCKLLYHQAAKSKAVEIKSSTLELLQEIPQLNETIDHCEKRMSEIKQAIMQEMQDADTLLFNGKTIVTWKAPKPSIKLDSKRLLQEHPDLFNQYQITIANSRRLIIKGSLLGGGEQS